MRSNRTNMGLLAAVLAVILATVAGQAWGQLSQRGMRVSEDPCLPMLADGVFDIYQLKSSSQFDAAFREWLLLDEDTRHDTQKASSAGAKAGYGTLWGEFSRSFSVSESQEWRKSIDAGTFADVLERSRVSVYTKSLGPYAVALADRFNECRRITYRGGGRVSLEGQGDGHVIMRIGFDAVPGGAASARLVSIQASHKPVNGSFDPIIQEKPLLGLVDGGGIAERAFVVKRGECDTVWVVATFEGFGDAPKALEAPVLIQYKKQMDEWKVKCDRVSQENRDADRAHDFAVSRWEAEQAAEDARFREAQSSYEQAIRDRRLVVAKRTKGGRGSDSDPNNRPYNFRLDIPNGSTLYFEVEPNAMVRMKRDRPNGEDPNIFEGIRNGSTFKTSWNPGCEHCDFYFKQDDVDQATITIWLNGKPEAPKKKTITKPEAPQPQAAPVPPTRPNC